MRPRVSLLAVLLAVPCFLFVGLLALASSYNLFRQPLDGRYVYEPRGGDRRDVKATLRVTGVEFEVCRDVCVTGKLRLSKNSKPPDRIVFYGAGMSDFELFAQGVSGDERGGPPEGWETIGSVDYGFLCPCLYIGNFQDGFFRKTGG